MEHSGHEEYQYINLIKNILENGTWEEGRNGKTKSIFGASMRFSLKDGRIPLITTKKTFWKTCLKELLWFISGETNNKILKDQGVHIWDGNSTREFLDNRGLTDYDVDELGPIYGYQWRYFNKPYVPKKQRAPSAFSSLSAWRDDEWIKEEPFVDQLQQIIDALKDPKQRTSRRLVMSAWNPSQLDEMVLPPCHIMCQFNVHDGNKLSCALYQRSADCALGVPFNIASYSFLTHLLAEHCGLEAHEFIHFMGNCHIYEDNIEPLKQIFDRTPYDFPKIRIKMKKDNINDYNIDDFEVIGYQCHEFIKMDMIA